MFSKINSQEIRCKNVPNAKIDFLTVHSAKGLGYDNCILINCSNEKFGFPSLIEDEPIISILKPKYNEEILYPEERRLFYVALTRTKNKLYITVPSTHESSFIEEIKTHKNVLYYKNVITCNDKIKTKYICPNCNNYLSIFNYKNSNYWIYECGKCHFKTSTPKKCIPIEKCPKCGEIVIYKYTYNDSYILKCFNKKCDYQKNIRIS